jgi:hypothetical protein
MAASFPGCSEREWIPDFLEGYTQVRAVREAVTALGPGNEASKAKRQLLWLSLYVPKKLESVRLTVDLTRTLRSVEIDNEYEEARAVRTVKGTYSVQSEKWTFELEVKERSGNLRPGVEVVEIPEKLEESFSETEGDASESENGRKGRLRPLQMYKH